MKVTDTYKEPITLKYPGGTVTVYHPELSTEEKERRMKIIHDAAANLLKSKGVK
jgi:hypothetical protein